ncbi:MAG: hypothetical protein QOH24_1266 [Verrucomicrobiota bacterium]
MRTLRLLAALALSVASAVVQAEDALPKRPDFKNYQAMLNRSPFAVATASAAGAAPDFAKDLYVANAARSPDADLVTIASASDKNFKKYLTTKIPVDGYAISNIEWSDRVGATKVTITKDGKYAALTFNQALLSQPLQNPAPAQPNALAQSAMATNQAAAGITPPQNYIKPAPVPSLPPPQPISPPATQNRPHVRGVIQRNPNTASPVPNVPPPESQQ